MLTAAPLSTPYRADSGGAGGVWRQDRANFIGAMTVTPEGFIDIDARIARPGVLTYRTENGIVRELVPESTLKDPAFIESLIGKPLVDEHPVDENGEPIDYLNPDNVKEHIGGIVLSAKYVDGDGLIARLRFMTRDIINSMRAGKVEVSPSYQTKPRIVSGVDPKYGPFDAIQDSRYAGNHVAITDRARGGSDVRLLLRNDSAGVEIEPAQPPIVEPPLKLSPAMMALLALLGLDPALYADDAAAAAGMLPKLQEMKAAIEGQEAAIVTMDAVPEAVATIAEAGPMADAAPTVKMDSKRADARRVNTAKAHAALTKFHNEATRLDSAEKALGIEGGAALGLAARTKAIVLKLDPNFDANESPEVYRAEFRAQSRQGFRADSAQPSVGALLADPENRNNGGGHRQDSAKDDGYIYLSATSAKHLGSNTSAAQ
tara:strand:- start:3293 stop:4585 length:1293 start_codon:yes stop_codon:yes gene_type:complete